MNHIHFLNLFQTSFNLYPSMRRERKRAAKSAAVLDAAMTIVAEDGLAGLSMGKVADRLDVAVGGLYRYFPSKEAIVVGLQRRAMERFATQLDEHLGQRHGCPLREAVAPFWFYVAQSQREPETARLFDAFLSAAEPILPLEDALSVEPTLEAILQRCDARLHAAAEAGALSPGDARERTLVLWGSLHGIGHFRHRQRFQPSAYAVEALARTLITTLLVGWGADPAEAARATGPAASG